MLMNTVRRRLGTGALAVLATAALVTSAAAQEKMRVDRLVRYFDTIVFGAEIEGVAAQNMIRKWNANSTLSYKIGGNTKSVGTFRPVIEKHAKSLAFDTGLKFREIGAREPGEHLIFWFADADKMVEAGLMIEKNAAVVRRVATGRCYFLSYNMPDGKFIRSMIVVNRANKFADIEHCLLEEMAQSLGLPNDDPLVSPSIFNDQEQHMELTRVDRFLLRTLYDKRLPAGTPRAQALTLARNIMLDLGKKSGWAE